MASLLWLSALLLGLCRLGTVKGEVISMQLNLGRCWLKPMNYSIT